MYSVCVSVCTSPLCVNVCPCKWVYVCKCRYITSGDNINYSPTAWDLLFMSDTESFITMISESYSCTHTLYPSSLLCPRLLISPLYNHLPPFQLLTFLLFSLPSSLRFPVLHSPCLWSPLTNQAGIQSIKNQFLRAALRHFKPVRCFASRYHLTSLFQISLN